MGTTRTRRLAQVAAVLMLALPACSDSPADLSDSAAAAATTAGDPSPAGEEPEPEPDTVSGDDGPAEFAIAMGGVDPEIRAGFESAGLEVDQMGSESRTDRFEYLAFYPQTLQVHRGDRIRFLQEGWHSAMLFLEPGEAPGPHSAGPTEDVIFVDGGGRPSDPSCITPAVDVAPGTAPCAIDDPEQAWSTGFNSAVIEFDLPAGTYSFVCGLHDDMDGTIEVVEDDVPIPSPDVVEAERRDLQAQDTENAERLLLEDAGAEVEADGDRRSWTLKAGDITDDGRVAIIRFLPGDLTVAVGDEVRWYVPSGPGYEAHTVSFPDGAYPAGIMTYYRPDFTVDPIAWRTPRLAEGGVIVDETTMHDTGFMGQDDRDCPWVCDPSTGQRWPSETSVTFANPGTYSYTCLVHPERGMQATITVVEA